MIGLITIGPAAIAPLAPLITGLSEEGLRAPQPHPAMVAPFVILLLAIAFMPFIHKHHWENHYAEISIGLGLVTVVYYLVALHDAPRMLSSLVDYVAFMALTGSLYVIAGGIHINMTGRSTPLVNTGILALGAVLAFAVGIIFNSTMRSRTSSR